MFISFVLIILLPWFNFLEETFSRIGHKVAKTCSCENIFHKNISYKRERVGVGATILVTFHINIFFLTYYVNIQPSCSKTRMEYFNIKIRLLKISKCLIILFVVFSFFVTKRTQSNSEKTSIWSTPKLLRKSVIFYWFFFLFFDKFNRLIGFCCNANLAILTHFEDEKKKKKWIRNLCWFCFVFVINFNKVFSVCTSYLQTLTFHCLVFFDN